MKFISIIIFVSAFSLIYFGMNYFALSRFALFFGKQVKIWPYAVLLTAAFPVVEILDRYVHFFATRILYYLVSAWMGIVFMLFALALALTALNYFFPIFSYRVIAYALIIFTVVLSGYAMVNANSVQTKKITLTDFGKELKIVQLSDIHIGTVWGSGKLRKIVEKTNELNPDAVMITGDLVDGTGKLKPDAFFPLNDLRAPVFFAHGNHEKYAGENRVEEYLRQTKVRTLQNEAVEFKNINIIGLDYGVKSENEFLKNLDIDKSLPALLLSHVPTVYADSAKVNVRLQLSGHTHHGQIFPFSLLVRIFFPKYKGLYDLGDYFLYVSPGTLTWGPPMRLGSRSEITLFKLN